MPTDAPETTPDRIGIAYGIAKGLYETGIRGPDGLAILAVAMRIYMASHDGAHRNLEALSEALLTTAKMAFDALQEGGHA